jgi:hypothetical protein
VLLASLRGIAKSLGIFAAICYVLARAVDRASAGKARLVLYRLVAQPVPRESGMGPAGAGAIGLRFVGPDDPVVPQFPRPPSVIERRFCDGARCLAAIKSERLVGFLWYKEHEYIEDDVRCCYRFDPSIAVWDFDVYIDPAFRLSRLFGRLWDRANRELSQHGYRWSLSRISAFNATSLAAHSRLGARRLGTAIFFVFGRVQFSVASLAPFVHLSCRAETYPVFTLNPEQASRATRPITSASPGNIQSNRQP